jgi:hypothetical protein
MQVPIMVEAFLAVVVLSSMCGFTGLAMAQGKEGDAFGTEVSSQCAQMSYRRVKDDCVRRLRSDAQLGSERSWQGGSAGSSAQGNAFGTWLSAGPGMMGQGKGRREKQRLPLDVEDFVGAHATT